MGNSTKRIFSIKELKKFDGKEGRPTYVAYKGLVYDVSSSHRWLNGTHMGRHFGGFDFTEVMENAPHNEEALLKFPVVGEISKLVSPKHILVHRIERLHLHSMLVHFPIAYPLIVFLLALVYILTGNISWERASYYMLTLGFLSAPTAALSGYFSWKVTYEGRMTKHILQKIVLSAVLIIVITVCFIWRSADSNLLTAETSLSYFYLTLLFSLIPIVAILGHLGGRIVYH